MESAYEEPIAWEVRNRQLPVEHQVDVPIRYKGHESTSPLRIDLIVAGLVIVECKAIAEHNIPFEAQTFTYLNLTGLKLGIVLNFGERLVRDGIHRVVNGL